MEGGRSEGRKEQSKTDGVNLTREDDMRHKYTVADHIFNIYPSFVVTPFDIFRSQTSFQISLIDLCLIY